MLLLNLLAIQFLDSLLIPGSLGGYFEIVESILGYYNKPAIVYAMKCNLQGLVPFFQRLNVEGHQTTRLNYESLDKVNYKHQNFKVFLLDIHCNPVTEILDKAEKKFFFRPPFRWIISYNQNLTSTQDIVDEYFKNRNLQLNSDITLLGKADASIYKVDKIYRFKLQYDVKIEYLGIWENTSEFRNAFIEHSLGKYRYNLEGKILKSVLYVHDLNSVNHLTDKRVKELDSKAKVDYAITLLLMESVNAVLNCKTVHIYDYFTGNMTIHLNVYYRRVDFAATGLAMGEIYLDKLDWTDPTSSLRYIMLLKQPKLSSVENLYVLTYSSVVWYATISVTIVMMLLLWCTRKWESKIETRQSNDNDVEAGLLETSYIVFSEICKQGSLVMPNSTAGRITAIVLMIFIVFLHTSYSATITSLLNSSRNYLNQLEDLLQHNIRIWMDFASFYIYHTLDRSGTIQEEILVHNVDPTPMEMDMGIYKLYEDQTAFQGCIDDILPVIERTFSDNDKCRLSQMDYLGQPVAFFTLPKNSTLNEAFRIKLKKINEAGLRKREFKLLYSEMPQCRQSSVFVVVSLQDCYPALVLLAAGILAAIVILFLEFYQAKFRFVLRKKNKKHHISLFSTRLNISN